jgi:predicted O-linked N-acetylglucosamine transferase (SPINDLY family)
MDKQRLLLAVEHHQAGRLQEAHELYGEILQADPNETHALRYLGLMAFQLGNHDQAIDLIERAHRHGRPDAQSLNTLGMAHAAAQRFREAKRSFVKALGLKADYADAHGNLASTLRALGQLKEAETSYRRALALDPRSADAHYNLANLLVELRKLTEAQQHFERAIALRPDYVQAHNNLGNALLQAGRLDEAERALRAAIAIQPGYAPAHHNLGNLLREGGRRQEAEQSYRAALAIEPRLLEARISLGNVLHQLDRFDEAVAAHQEALALHPDVAAVHYNLGNSLASLDRWEEAAANYAKAISLEPDFAAARWALAMVQLPSVYETQSQLEERRIAFAQHLDVLTQWIEANPSVDGAAALVQQPFQLAYDEENNRDLLARYGDLCKTVMDRWRTKERFAASTRGKGRTIRLGVVSAHVHAHSVWHAVIKGWLQQLDRDGIELHVFHLGNQRDTETELAKASTAHFVEGPRTLREWARVILELDLDVLAYPEIGMHSLTAQLASLRLARVQLAAWGHPQTTGIPTIDYYVSADAFEPPEAQQHYTEQLVRLPNLGCFYQPYGTTPAMPDLAAMGIPQDVPLLLCCGTPSKYLPHYDQLLVTIAKALVECRFAFFADSSIPASGKLRRRLQRSFDDGGLDFTRHVVFLPWQPQAQFYGLMTRADVFLDTVGFSGFNTAMQAVECALPIVAMEGKFMRGRFGSAILKHMQLDELVAGSPAAYVELAVKLVRDAGYRKRVRSHMQTSQEVLYSDETPIRALQQFLITVARR